MGLPPDVAEELGKLADVSRETRERLELYVARLLTWQQRLNLIGASTIPDVWRRHVLDSAQLMPLIGRESRRLVDLGSGAGFPGLVLAIMGARGVELIEADERKAAFLADAIRATGVAATVRTARVEDLRGPQADTVTARALAPLPRLLALARPFVHGGTRCLFLKGARVEAELTDAYKMWKMRVELVPSRTDPHGRIVVIEGLSHDAEPHAARRPAARAGDRQPEGRRR
jgi:16S rRNA (guanine527-N7)-methyltransferase